MWRGFIIVLGAFAVITSVADPLHDPFDNRQVDKRLWDQSLIEATQIDFDTLGRCGRGAIVVTARAGEGVKDCDNRLCQRLELREKHRRNFGEDVWYSFSFKVEGDVPTSSVVPHWVLAQWKEETDQSPFVAQRFGNGVFQITVEDNGVRRLIASSRATPAQIDVFHKTVDTLGKKETLNLTNIARELRALEKNTTTETQYQALVNKLLPPNLAAESLNLWREFDFLTDPELYAGPSSVVIEPGPHPILPDPTLGWVDMRYHIRGDTNGGARVQVWANDTLVVTATGSIGHKIHAGPTQYFKFGHYRDVLPGTVRLLFDEFRRGSTEAQVKSACP